MSTISPDDIAQLESVGQVIERTSLRAIVAIRGDSFVRFANPFGNGWFVFGGIDESTGKGLTILQAYSDYLEKKHTALINKIDAVEKERGRVNGFISE